MRKTLTFLVCLLILTSSLGAVDAQAGCAPSQLVPYQAGRVAPEVSNGMYSEPLTSAYSFGAIPGNGLVITLETGVCTGGYLWAQVYYYGMRGWITEAQGDEYYVFPVPPPDGAVILPLIPFEIGDVAWSADGSRIAIATSRGVYLIHTRSPNPAPIHFSEGDADEVEFSPTKPEVLAASSGCYGMVRVWDISTDEVLYDSVLNEPGSLSCLTGRGTLKFDSSGETLFAAPAGAITLDSSTWEQTASCCYDGIDMSLMSPDGEQVAILPYGENLVYLSDWSNNRTPLSRGDLDGFILSMEFSPDSSMVAILDQQKNVQRWILTTGEQATYRLPYEGDYPIWYPQTLLAFSPDSTLLAVGEFSDQPNALRLLDAATMQDAGLFQPENVAEVKTLAFNADGTRIAVIFGNLLMMVETEDVRAGAG